MNGVASARGGKRSRRSLLEKQARIAAEADKPTASQRLAAADDDWERMPGSELAATVSDDDVVRMSCSERLTTKPRAPSRGVDNGVRKRH
ncbi:hypothetical protein DIPPA_20254 [Diplonema papillatum]|nr:hypothetical protein DIPPA_20254 [Diplonema papillatum]